MFPGPEYSILYNEAGEPIGYEPLTEEHYCDLCGYEHSDDYCPSQAPDENEEAHKAEFSLSDGEVISGIIDMRIDDFPHLLWCLVTQLGGEVEVRDVTIITAPALSQMVLEVEEDPIKRVTTIRAKTLEGLADE